MKCFADLLDVHREIDELVFDVWQRIVDRQWATIAPATMRLDRRLRAHIAVEDEHLVPAYARWVHPPDPALSAAMILRDHRLIERHLEGLARDVPRGAPASSSEARALVAFAERLAGLADLLEHHDLREASGFKPLLDAHLPGEVAGPLLAHAARQEKAASEAARAPLAHSPGEMGRHWVARAEALERQPASPPELARALGRALWRWQYAVLTAQDDGSVAVQCGQWLDRLSEAEASSLGDYDARMQRLVDGQVRKIAALWQRARREASAATSEGSRADVLARVEAVAAAGRLRRLVANHAGHLHRAHGAATRRD